MLPYTDKRIVIFVGGYGSGKTEVAINYAFGWKTTGDKLALVDLDIVNPYFRSRERLRLFADRGIEVIAPHGALATADLPALPPEIYGVLQNGTLKGVFDVGGDEVGARVLGRYSRMFVPGEYEMLFVINASRPFSQNLEAATGLMSAIEKASRLQITGLVNNTNLMQYTDLALVGRGEDLALAIGAKTGLPLVFNAVARELLEKDESNFSAPILPLHLYMKRPWE